MTAAINLDFCHGRRLDLFYKDLLRYRRRVTAGSVALTLMLVGLPHALAQNAAAPQPRPSALPGSAQRTVTLAIRPQPLSSALVQFARAADIDLVLDGAIPPGVRTQGVSGTLALPEALNRLLAGSGFSARLTGSRTVRLVSNASLNAGRAPGGASSDTVSLGQIDVIASRGRDAGATEHSTLYTSDIASVGSRLPLSIRETPQSISVITQQRIRDQNMGSLDDALQNAPGITLNAASGGHSFDSRGFTINTATVDGLAKTLDGQISGPIDLAPYDRVEVLRGPAGLFNGAGNPGGSVNLARKRALDIFQLKTSASTGSWSRLRGEADITGPLNASKTVRGRFVAAGLARDWFVDTFDERRSILYGTLEFDLSEATTLSVGAIKQNQRYTPYFGLPAHPDGRFAAVPRSTYLGPDWNFIETDSFRLFADLEHRFSNGGLAKLSARYANTDVEYRSAYGNALVSNLTPQWLDRTSRDLSVDAHVTTPFHLFGQQQNILIGANYHSYRNKGANRFGTVIGRIDVYDPRHDFRYPADDEYTVRQRTQVSSTSYGLYGQARLKPVQWATLVLGGRLSRYESEDINRITAGTANIVQQSVTRDRVFTPYAGVVFDLSQQISAYASYSSIFYPQGLTTVDGRLLPPIEGNQYEAGLTGSFFNQTLNTRLAVFRIQRENAARSDPDNPGFYIADGRARSQGFEAEVSGRLLPGWDIAASYTYTDTRYLRSEASNQGRPYSTLKPRHLAKLWSKYTFEHGTWAGFSIGAGLRWQSLMYVQGSGNIRWTQPAYSVVDLQLGYKVNENLDMAFTVTNLFDKRYYQTIGRAVGNFVGEPRAFLLRVNAKW